MQRANPNQAMAMHNLRAFPCLVAGAFRHRSFPLWRRYGGVITEPIAFNGRMRRFSVAETTDSDHLFKCPVSNAKIRRDIASTESLFKQHTAQRIGGVFSRTVLYNSTIYILFTDK